MENEQVVRNYQNKHLLSTPLYTDMAGGLNTRVSPAQMAVNQSGMARNVIYNTVSGALSARDGTAEYNPLAVPLAATSGVSAFLQAKYAGGAWRDIVIGGSEGSVAAYALNHPTGNAWSAANHVSVTKIPASRRTSTCFYNNVVVCFDGVNNPYKLFLDSGNGGAFTMAPYFPNGDVAAAPAHLTAAEFVVAYNNKLYYAGSNSSMLGWSDPLAADSALGALPNFPSANRELIGSLSDGDSIMGLAVAYGHLIIFKRNSIFALSESAGVPSVTQIGRSVGLIAKHAFCNAENSVWFFGPSGVYSIGSDLTPQYESDFVLPDYQKVMNGFEVDFEVDGATGIPSTNAPVFAYNMDKQQVWISCFSGNGVSPARDIVYIHDLINKDSSGRCAISTYVFYQSAIRNYTPVLLCESTNPQTGRLELLSLSRKTEAAADNPEGVKNPYHIYKHDVPVSDGSLGDDGNLVEFMWESKYFNLGDPMRLKAPRYLTIMGDQRDEVSTTFTNQNYLYNTPEQYNRRKVVFPKVARGMACCQVGGYVFCAGGVTSAGDYLSSVYIYNIAADSWSLSAVQLPAGTAYAQLVTDGTFLYLVGGTTAASSATRKVYAASISSPGVITNFQEVVRAGGGDALSYARSMFGCAMVGSKIYAFGGSYNDSAHVASTFESFDVGSRQATALSTPYTGVLAGPSLVAMSSGGFDYLFLFYGSLAKRYSVSGGLWVGSGASGRGNYVFSGAFSDGTYIWLLGGLQYDATPGAGAAVDVVQRYTPSFNGLYTGDSYTSRAPIASPRGLFGFAHTGAGGNAFIIGGTGFPVRVYVSSTDDFKNYTSTEIDVTMNVRQVAPPSINYLSRYWSITFRGRITEGISRVIGFCLDYVMFQRRG